MLAEHPHDPTNHHENETSPVHHREGISIKRRAIKMPIQIPQKLCGPCHFSCLKCRGPNDYDCTSCAPDSSVTTERTTNESYCLPKSNYIHPPGFNRKIYIVLFIIVPATLIIFGLIVIFWILKCKLCGFNQNASQYIYNRIDFDAANNTITHSQKIGVELSSDSESEKEVP